jgi:hypothetical protein
LGGQDCEEGDSLSLESLMGPLVQEARKSQAEAQKVQIEILRVLLEIRTILRSIHDRGIVTTN